MVVGILTVDLFISDANSLKDKRQVIKSLVTIARTRYNVSVAETDALDTWRKAIIGVACVSNDRKIADKVLNKVLAQIEANPRVSVEGCQIEFL